MVIFTPSSRSTSSSGDGKKSLTTSSRPSGSSRYLRLRFINLLSSALVSGTNNANHIATVCKPYGEHASTSFSEAIKPWLALTVREILGDHTCWIRESELRVHKRHAVLPLVLRALGRIPLEARLTAESIADVWASHHTWIWVRLTSNGEVERPRRSAQQAPRARNLFQRPRCLTAGASRPLQRIRVAVDFNQGESAA